MRSTPGRYAWRATLSVEWFVDVTRNGVPAAVYVGRGDAVDWIPRAKSVFCSDAQPVTVRMVATDAQGVRSERTVSIYLDCDIR